MLGASDKEAVHGNHQFLPVFANLVPRVEHGLSVRSPGTYLGKSNSSTKDLRADARLSKHPGGGGTTGLNYSVPVRRFVAGVPAPTLGRRTVAITSDIESFQIFAAALLSAGRAW